MKNDFILIIPARLESTRLPKKLLINIEGLSIIQRTYNCALKAVKDREKIIIATDSDLIKNHCEEFGSYVLKTSEDCLTGTDRVAEVSEKIEANQYINLQGDEPIFPSEEILKVAPFRSSGFIFLFFAFCASSLMFFDIS